MAGRHQSKRYFSLPIVKPANLHLSILITHHSNTYRTTSEELRASERLLFDHYNDLRKGAEVHRQVRVYARKTIKPGMSMIEIAELIENGTRTLIEENGLEAG